MTIPLVVVGAGGFGREVLDVVEAVNGSASTPVFTLLGVLDANPTDANLDRLAARGIRYLGTESHWLATRQVAQYLIGIGSPAVRRSVDQRFSAAGLIAASAVHPSAIIGSAFTISAGSIICGGVHISTNVTLGRQVHLNPHVTLGHDSVVGDFVSINPGAIISGDVTVGAGALVGAGATVLQGLSVGPDAVIGASACVVRDVSPATTVKGVPAR